GEGDQEEVGEADGQPEADARGEAGDACPGRREGHGEQHHDEARRGEGELQVEIDQALVRVDPLAAEVLDLAAQHSVAQLLRLDRHGAEILERFGDGEAGRRGLPLARAVRGELERARTAQLPARAVPGGGGGVAICQALTPQARSATNSFWRARSPRPTRAPTSTAKGVTCVTTSGSLKTK